jgi:hypothetical protein
MKIFLDADRRSAFLPGAMVALLDLVRRLIDYGKDLAATLQQRVTDDPFFARCAFGTRDLAVILARITRGLHCANALEARLVPLAARPERRLTPVTASSQRRPNAARPACSRSAKSLLAQLPTPEQIAAAIRRRPIGAVIADICRDLGILPNHPLWRDLQKAIMHHGGSYVRLLKDILTRPSSLSAEDDPLGPAAFRPPQAGTGPP